jgi:hypothetical protein
MGRGVLFCFHKNRLAQSNQQHLRGLRGITGFLRALTVFVLPDSYLQQLSEKFIVVFKIFGGQGDSQVFVFQVRI